MGPEAGTASHEDEGSFRDVARLFEDAARSRPTLQHSGYWRHRVKSGRVIDVEIVSHTITFADRKAALVVAQDVTELLRKQKALRESEERYALAVLGANAIVFAEGGTQAPPA